MFSFLKTTASSLYAQAKGIFSRSAVDEQSLKELEHALIEADTGVTTARTIITKLKAELKNKALTNGNKLKEVFCQELKKILLTPFDDTTTTVFLLVGINGSGKTTFAGKLAHRFTNQGKRVLLAAGDTFRAAASEQIAQWAEKTGATLVRGTQAQDPASVVFQACERFKQEQFDTLIIDTAGRLQTKINLMKELEKIKRIITKQLPNHTVRTLLTIDAMLGQNSLEQAKIFHEATALDGIVLTKMDGTGKGGIIFAINQELHIPVAYISYGEEITDMTSFDPHKYIQDTFN